MFFWAAFGVTFILVPSFNSQRVFFGPNPFFSQQFNALQQTWFPDLPSFFRAFSSRHPMALTNTVGRGLNNRFLPPIFDGRVISHPPIVTEPFIFRPRPSHFLVMPDNNNHEDQQLSFNSLSHPTAHGLSSLKSQGFGQAALNTLQSQPSVQGIPLTSQGFRQSLQIPTQGLGLSSLNTVQSAPSLTPQGFGQAALNTMQNKPFLQGIPSTSQGFRQSVQIPTQGLGLSSLNALQSAPSLQPQGFGQVSLNADHGSSFAAQHNAQGTPQVQQIIHNNLPLRSGRLISPEQQEGRSLNNTILANADPVKHLQSIVNSTLFYGSLFDLPPVPTSLVNNLTVLKRSEDILPEENVKRSASVQLVLK